MGSDGVRLNRYPGWRANQQKQCKRRRKRGHSECRTAPEVQFAPQGHYVIGSANRTGGRSDPEPEVMRGFHRSHIVEEAGEFVQPNVRHPPRNPSSEASSSRA